MLSPPSAKKLSSRPTRSSRSTSANSPHSTASAGVRAGRYARSGPASGAGSARRSSLPFARQRQPIQNHESLRHHVVRQRRRQRQPKLRHVRHGARLRHHVAHQPTLAAALRRARNHRGRRHTRLPDQQRLDLARLDPEPAQLHLRVRTAQKLQNTVRTPPRKVTGPVHPRARQTMRIRDEALRRQTRPMQITTRKTKPRDVQLARNAKRNRLKTKSPERRRDSSGVDGRSGAN